MSQGGATANLGAHRRQRCAVLANSLTKKAPYKGLGADSEEKREPVSDIDIAAVDSLKVLDLNRPIREADKLPSASKRRIIVTFPPGGSHGREKADSAPCTTAR